MTVNGLDISSVQGEITDAQARAIASRGTRFIIQKCFEGNKGKDLRCDQDIARFRAIGAFVLGRYNFPYLGLPVDAAHAGRSPEDQADAHWAAGEASRQPGDLADTADFEWPDSSLWGKPIQGVDNSIVTHPAALDCAMRYLARYKSHQGCPCIVYGAPWFLHELGLPAEVTESPLWIAAYAKGVPPIPPWSGWSLWQTGGGSLQRLPSGVPVDTDVCVDEATLQSLCIA